MITRIKNLLPLLLVILLLASPLEAVFAATVSGMSCNMQTGSDMTIEQEVAYAAEHGDKQHQQQCNEGQCTHSICASPAFSLNSNPAQLPPHVADSKISAVYSLSVETFPTSLFRPPRA